MFFLKLIYHFKYGIENKGISSYGFYFDLSVVCGRNTQK